MLIAKEHREGRLDAESEDEATPDVADRPELAYAAEGNGWRSQ
jgi:hypothetical protein